MFKTKKIQDKTVYYSDIADNFSDKFEHFFTSRDLIVKDNINLLSQYLKIKPENLIKPNQTHGTNIAIVETNKEFLETDGLILDNFEIGIYLNFADCTPVVLYDYKKNIGAIAHAGWRGTAGMISKKTIYEMVKLYGCETKDMIGIIGPCISFEQFETYDEALFLLKNSVEDDKGLFRGNFADLKGINKKQLEESGVEKIDVCPYCTVLDNDKFFSYRKEDKTKNRHSAVIKLNKI